MFALSQDGHRSTGVVRNDRKTSPGPERRDLRPTALPANRPQLSRNRPPAFVAKGLRRLVLEIKYNKDVAEYTLDFGQAAGLAAYAQTICPCHRPVGSPVPHKMPIPVPIPVPVRVPAGIPNGIPEFMPEL